MWYEPPGRVPMPLNTSAYSCRMYSLVVGKGWVFPSIVMEFLHQETCGDFGSCTAPNFALVTTLCSSCAVWLNFDWSNFWSNLGPVDLIANFDWSNFQSNLGPVDLIANFDWSNFRSNLGSVT